MKPDAGLHLCSLRMSQLSFGTQSLVISPIPKHMAVIRCTRKPEPQVTCTKRVRVFVVLSRADSAFHACIACKSYVLYYKIRWRRPQGQQLSRGFVHAWSGLLSIFLVVVKTYSYYFTRVDTGRRSFCSTLNRDTVYCAKDIAWSEKRKIESSTLIFS